MFDQQFLLTCNQMGLIPGPLEAEEAFYKRADYCLNLRKNFGEETILPETLSFSLTKKLWDIAPSWVPVVLNKRKLRFWQGACTWLFQENENTPYGAFVQIKRRCFTEEILSHEMSHVGRMEFDEPKYEEFLAYQSSSSWLYKKFGPIFETSRETLLFVGIIFLITLTDFIFFHPLWILFTKFLLIALAGLSVVRLRKKEKTFERCLENLSKVTSFPYPVIYRMTDKEIEKLSTCTPLQTQEFIFSQSCLRWTIIILAYFNPNPSKNCADKKN